MYIVPHSSDSAHSYHVGQILTIIIVILLAAMVLLILLQYQISLSDQRIPCIFEITNVRHTSEAGIMTEASYVVLQNTDTKAYDNWNLYAFTYINGNQITADLPTLNTDEFIHIVNRRGVWHLEGFGASGSRQKHDAYWYPRSSLAIDYSDHTIHQGDRVTIEIYDKTTNQLISRDTFPHTDTKTKEMLDEYFNRLNA